MTEACNYRCDYCYAIWDTDCHSKEIHSIEGAVEALIDELACYFFSDNPLQESMRYERVRLNFAGGEPMLLGKRLAEALLYAKRKGFSTSIITNGAFLDDERLTELAAYIDVLGVSFDSADPITAQTIGRVDRKGGWISGSKLAHIASMYRLLNPLGIFKVNTVVNEHNYRESLVEVMKEVNPDKWKVLRVLPVLGHIKPVTNIGFNDFVNRHAMLSHIWVVEDNNDMQGSYLMVNPEGCFYQNSPDELGYITSDAIVDVGAGKAFEQISFDTKTFLSRYT